MDILSNQNSTFKGLRANPSRPGKTRGVSNKKYAELMHKIERGEISEATLVRRKVLSPGRGIGIRRDDQIFSVRAKERGRGDPNHCQVKTCPNKPSRRGLCNTHRTYCKRMIRLGKANETNLINRKLLLPSQTQRETMRSAPRPSRPSNPSSRQNKNLPKRLSILTAKHCLFPNCNKKRKPNGRGLCKKHYRLYLRKLSNLDDRKKKLLEKDLIKRKLLLVAEQATEADAFEIGSKIRGIIHRT